VKEFARAAGCELPVIEQAVGQYERYVSQGNEMADSTSVARFYERRS
jgi:3-hydroxyisobutyrate dehydrogenase-like beta-hydroxyacid dehydrogenase